MQKEREKQMHKIVDMYKKAKAFSFFDSEVNQGKQLKS